MTVVVTTVIALFISFYVLKSGTETTIHDIELKLCEEEVYSNLELMQKLNGDLKIAKETLDSLYEEWDNML